MKTDQESNDEKLFNATGGADRTPFGASGFRPGCGKAG
jgi:hypothetical protein